MKTMNDEQRKLAPTRGTSQAVRNYPVAVEVRAADAEGRAGFTGHASVTGIGYDMYGGPDKGGWTEYIDSGAFRKTLRENPDVAFLVNHTGLTMARTKAGTLRLSEDDIGLLSEADLDSRRSDVADVLLALESGDVDEMSFAFRVTQQVWLNADGEEVPWWDLSGIERHITEVDIHKGDVSVVNYGANPYTDAGLRSLAESLRALTADQVDPDEVKATIDHLRTLLPEPSAQDGPSVAELLARNAARRYPAAS